MSFLPIRRSSFGFLDEAAFACGIGEIRMKNLDGEHAIKNDVAGFVNGSHTTETEFSENFVMGERLADHGENTSANDILTQRLASWGCC
jgi:hypothetical protein